jgi:hypothetical protein
MGIGTCRVRLGVEFERGSDVESLSDDVVGDLGQACRLDVGVGPGDMFFRLTGDSSSSEIDKGVKCSFTLFRMKARSLRRSLRIWYSSPMLPATCCSKSTQSVM